MFGWILLLFFASASTMSIMGKYVDNERVAGERRMDALFGKKIEVLCPGYNQKGMSLCARQYVRHAKIETSSGFVALSHFINVAGTQDYNGKIYDETTANIITMETLILLQDQLKKEHMVCSQQQASGPQNLLEIKKVCAQEEEQFRNQQEKNKKYIQRLLSDSKIRVSNYKNEDLKKWLMLKQQKIERELSQKYEKTFFNESEYQITANDILRQHKLTIQTSCNKLGEEYKQKFNTQNPCEIKFSQILLSCVEMKSARKPASLKEKEFVEMVKKPLPCFYSQMQQFLMKGE